MSDYCYLPLGSLCLGSVDVSISGTPPPSHRAGRHRARLADRRRRAASSRSTTSASRSTSTTRAASRSTASSTCTVPTTTIVGDYDLSPLAAAADQGRRHAGRRRHPCRPPASPTPTDCDGLLGDLEESLIGAGDRRRRRALRRRHGGLPEPGRRQRQHADRGRDRDARSRGVDIAGPVGGGLGIDLDAPFTSIVEDAIGITFAANIAATTPSPASRARRVLAASYHVAEAFPTFGATTPVQHLPYGIGLAHLDLGLQPAPARADRERPAAEHDHRDRPRQRAGRRSRPACSRRCFPEFGVLPPATPIAIRIAPTLAPVLTGASRPGGRARRDPHGADPGRVRAERRDCPARSSHLALAVDARVGLAARVPARRHRLRAVSRRARPTSRSRCSTTRSASARPTLQSFLPSADRRLPARPRGALQSFPLPAVPRARPCRASRCRATASTTRSSPTSTPACTVGRAVPERRLPGERLPGADLHRRRRRTARETGARLRRRELSRLRDGRGVLPVDRTAPTGGCSGGICQPPCTTRRAVSERRLHGRLLSRAELRRRRAERRRDRRRLRRPAPNCLRCAAGAGLRRARPIARAASAPADVCQPPTCTDGVKNGTETDIDCGGGSCPGCGARRHCAAPAPTARAACAG